MIYFLDDQLIIAELKWCDLDLVTLTSQSTLNTFS